MSPELVKIHPPDQPLRGEVRVPYSKPHMQRAILLSLLTNAPAVMVHPAWSSESRDLYEAARQFGLDVVHHDPTRLVVTGVGRSLSRPRAPVWTAGSAFNFRTVAALACLAPGETVIEGNASMRSRSVTGYLNFIHDLGARIDDLSDDEHLRIRVAGGRLLGGETTIDTRHSSQALTAALLVAPLADGPVRIDTDGAGLVGEGYVDLTVDMMREQGAAVIRHGASFVVNPSLYESRMHLIASDFTALSYLAGAVAVTRNSEVTVTGYRPSSLSSEAQLLAVLRMLGVRTSYDPVTRSMHLRPAEPETDSIEIDGRNIPTVIPTIAAIAPFVEAKVTVRNVAHVNNHKCPRVAVMLRELSRMGCRMTPIYRDDGLLDGFRTSGRQNPAGGVALTSQGDHRIFMSLATAALGARSATVLDGAEHLHASFPDYLDVMARTGVRWTGAGKDPVGLAVETLGSR